MKKVVGAICLLFISLTVSAGDLAELTGDGAKTVTQLLQQAHAAGNSSIQVHLGKHGTRYSIGNLTCYSGKDDGSALCKTETDLTEDAALLVGNMVREIYQKAAAQGTKTIVQLEGGTDVLQYHVENLTCYFKNDPQNEPNNNAGCSVED